MDFDHQHAHRNFLGVTNAVPARVSDGDGVEAKPSRTLTLDRVFDFAANNRGVFWIREVLVVSKLFESNRAGFLCCVGHKKERRPLHYANFTTLQQRGLR